jgi:hypothetical protein
LSLEFQDTPEFKIKIPKQARFLMCQISESDDIPELIDDGSDSDSEYENTSIDDNLLAKNHGGEGKYCFPASIRSIEEDSIIDSGCSQTAVNDEKLFNFFRRRKQVVNTVGPTVKVELSGPIGPFPDVFLIPILTHNLISIKDLCDLGITVSFDQGTLVMEMDGVQIMRIKTEGDVWTCNFKELCEKILASMPAEAQESM